MRKINRFLYQIKDQSFIDADLVLWGLGFDI
jgi:hypothetical protein